MKTFKLTLSDPHLLAILSVVVERLFNLLGLVLEHVDVDVVRLRLHSGQKWGQPLFILLQRTAR